MFKQITTAVSITSLLVVTGCSTLVGGSKDLDPTADCLTEITQLNNLGLTSEESGKVMFEYWRTETDVIRPFVRASTIVNELPENWHDRFTAEVEGAFTQAFATACVVKGATVHSASLEAASFTNVWLDIFMQRLEDVVTKSNDLGA